MSFRTYFCPMDARDRAEFAARAGSSVGYLLQVAYGNKRVELGFADVLVAVADGALQLGDLPLTERAIEQHKRRQLAGSRAFTGTPAAELEGQRHAA